MLPNSNSFRVLFVLPAFYRNGAVNLIINLADELALVYLDVEILALSEQEPHSPLPKQAVKTSVALEANQSVRLGLPILLNRLLKSALNSDLIVLTWENGPALVWTSLIAYILRKPTIAIVQNNIQKSWAQYPSRIGRVVRRWAYGQTQAVVCVSQALITFVEAEINSKTITSIPNGINIERVQELAKLPDSSLLTTDNLPFIVGIGRLVPQKGFDLLIKAHAAVIKKGIAHHLVLIGEGEEHSNLSELATNLGVFDSVNFLGFSSNPYSTLARASLFCLSSRYEGMPLSLMEASVLGIPMIATDCLTGPREILADGLYGDLVATESVEALSSAIERHFLEPQRLVTKAQASAQQAERFSMRTCADKYRELFAHCVAKVKENNKD
ncbi:glycosyl transferase group 1 [Stanieria cyanosphaera PCC 7437]|uniref:Glycosyl transferase group 1 n=1 Tax=Stanieria cyanosphaera (strain ATCC 29371 / PCC 7437) TaxID=111780 RepID=K9XWY1_STAC7|nr:glycosyltransferase [Stanieria cyanosphaera]AFZ37105.1 glycosyl transferase group 1 [Stanieria cyanosphaera PCC 7437]